MLNRAPPRESHSIYIHDARIITYMGRTAESIQKAMSRVLYPTAHHKLKSGGHVRLGEMYIPTPPPPPGMTIKEHKNAIISFYEYVKMTEGEEKAYDAVTNALDDLERDYLQRQVAGKGWKKYTRLGGTEPSAWGANQMRETVKRIREEKTPMTYINLVAGVVLLAIAAYSLYNQYVVKK